MSGKHTSNHRWLFCVKAKSSKNEKDIFRVLIYQVQGFLQ